jgi:hypothetical protein
MIAIIVGTSASTATFHVYKASLRARSRLVDNALKTPWTESSTRVIPLPNGDPIVFASYLRLIFKGISISPDMSIVSQKWHQV